MAPKISKEGAAEKLVEVLASYDWGGAMSGDHERFMAAEGQASQVRKLIAQLDEATAKKIWAEHAPPDQPIPALLVDMYAQ